MKGAKLYCVEATVQTLVGSRCKVHVTATSRYEAAQIVSNNIIAGDYDGASVWDSVTHELNKAVTSLIVTKSGE